MLTRTYIFDRYVEAKHAVLALEEAGIAPHFTTIIGRGGDDLVTLTDYVPTPRIKAVDTAGLLGTLGLLVLPGIGLLAAGGWLPTGIVARGSTGDAIVATLLAAGHSAEEADILAEALHRGATLVGLRSGGDHMPGAESLMIEQGGVAPSVRGIVYREDGWQGFDPKAAPYTSEEVYDERMRYSKAA